MAEAIGLGASVVTLVQLTAQLAAVSFKYIGGVKQARDEIQKLVYEIRSLSTVFANLEVCIQDGSGSTQLKELEDSLQKCTLEIKNFVEKLEPTGWSAKKMISLTWPFKVKETLDFVLPMERYKLLFLLMLKTIETKKKEENRSRSKLIEANVQIVGAHVQDIKNDVQEMNTRVEYIKDGVQDVKYTTGNIENNVQDVKNNIKDLMTESERQSDDKRRTEALNWLYPGTCNERHLEISRRRKKDTGLWIFDTPEVQDWVENTLPKSQLIGDMVFRVLGKPS